MRKMNNKLEIGIYIVTNINSHSIISNVPELPNGTIEGPIIKIDERNIIINPKQKGNWGDRWTISLNTLDRYPEAYISPTNKKALNNNCYEYCKKV